MAGVAVGDETPGEQSGGVCRVLTSLTSLR